MAAKLQVTASATPHSHSWQREVIKGEGSGCALNEDIQSGEYLGIYKYPKVAVPCSALTFSNQQSAGIWRKLLMGLSPSQPQGSGAALQRPHHSHFQACQAKGTVIASHIPPHFRSSELWQGPGTGAPISACLQLLQSREVTESSPGAERAARRDSNQHSDKAGPC